MQRSREAYARIEFLPHVLQDVSDVDATTAILGRYATHLSGPDARRRATLAASQLVGMAMLRYLIRIEPAASMTREQLVADLGPTVQRYLTGPLAAPEP